MIHWKIEEAGFNSENIAANGNRFLTGNGYMGVRGTLEEYTKEHLVAVNLAGIYDRVGQGWREPLNAPNGLYTILKADGVEYSLPGSQPCYHYCSLNYRKALFFRNTIWNTGKGQVAVESERFVSLADPHLIVLKYCITADHHAKIELITGIDGDVWDIHGPHYDDLAFSAENDCLTAVATTHENKDKVYVAEACSYDFISNTEYSIEDKRVLRHLSFTAKPGVKYILTKWISVYTSKDASDAGEAVRLALHYRLYGYDHCKDAHIEKWEEKWSVSEVMIDGDDAAMEALNYSLYHLICIAPRHSKSMSIAARGLSGQTYKGAVFWDTEMFMLDFFIFTEPEVAKTLLRYRIDTLNGALAKAKHYGYEGAFYAWESQEGGYDACSDYNVTDVFTGRPMRTYFKDKQVHISSAIVYGIMKYIHITGDDSLLWENEARGWKTITECAKFYYSLLLKRLDSNLYEIHDVIGPDEYHERVNNNGYTNRMAKYTFDTAIRIIDLMDGIDDDLGEKIKSEYPVEELRAKFSDASAHIYIPEPKEDGVIEQFDGYDHLEDATPGVLKGRLLHEKEYWGGAYGVASHTKVIKQADVVTWLALFPGDFPTEIMLANWNYYEPRTEHGSSLSACMYALLACRCGRPDLAYPFFLKSATADLMGGGKQWAGLVYIGGTHPAAQGGAYIAAIRGFGGLDFEGEKITLTPRLPESWHSLKFKVWYRGRLYLVEETAESAKIELLQS